MKKKIVIDGRHLAGMTGGVQRYLREILLELDKIALPEDYEILVPPKSHIPIKFNNISVVEYGLFKGLLWEQVSLPFYLWKNQCYGIFPCTIVPLLYPHGIAILHDVMMAKKPELSESFSSPLAKRLLLCNYKIAAKRANIVVTVSENSKRDISEIYHTNLDDIYVVPNAWQHFNHVTADDSWIQNYPQLKSGEFFFSLSANRKQKNFKWIFEMAKRNPQTIFAMAGTQEEWQKEQEYSAPNIIHMGYISDGVIKSLMQNCKAFLFPSIYEGFGIPPLEALSVGAKIIVANTSCLPEIYQKSAYYIDPYSYEVNLEQLLSSRVAPAEDVLKRFGWDMSAQKLHAICAKLRY